MHEFGIDGTLRHVPMRATWAIKIVMTILTIQRGMILVMLVVNLCGCPATDCLPCRLERDFSVGEMLGKGGFATVYKVKGKIDGGSYALKIVKLPNK